MTRWAVYAPVTKRTSDAVTEYFGFVETSVLAFEDLYGGKLHAAFDRRHPRDVFDVKLLYENEGVMDELFRVFMVYVASSGRPMQACFVQVWGSHRDTGVEFGFVQGVQSAEGRGRLIAGVERFSERDRCEKVWPRRVGIVRGGWRRIVGQMVGRRALAGRVFRCATWRPVRFGTIKQGPPPEFFAPD